MKTGDILSINPKDLVFKINGIVQKTKIHYESNGTFTIDLLKNDCKCIFETLLSGKEIKVSTKDCSLHN